MKESLVVLSWGICYVLSWCGSGLLRASLLIFVGLCVWIASTLEKNQIETQTRQELLNLYDIITNQNYFTNNEKILI